MDPVTAFGVAAAILQFIQFGAQIVSKGNRIYHTGEGVLSENHDLELVTNHLLALQAKMDRTAQQSSGVNSAGATEDAALQQVRATATELAKTLLARLNMVKAQGQSRRWKSFRQALKCISSQKEINSLAQRLKSLEHELQMQILVSLTDKVDTLSESHSQQLQLMDQSHKVLWETLKNLRDISNTSQNLSDGFSAKRAEPTLEEPPSVFLDTGSNLPPISEQRDERFRRPSDHDSLHVLESVEGFQKAIVKTLKFPGLESRELSVVEAHARTFSWIFHDSTMEKRGCNSFVNWLRCGKGMYWINGKAASGKSTLMKFLAPHPIVRHHLEEQLGETPLIDATFFFWSTGTTLQKSQAGLLRSLICQVLKKLPEFIELDMRWILSGPWQRLMNMRQTTFNFSKVRNKPYKDPVNSLDTHWYTWTLSDLKLVFNRLLHNTQGKVKICFFIDGLDEFDGTHTDMVALFKEISRFAHTKICISSRPLLIFEQEYGHFPKLRLQKLTRDDMSLFVRDKLSEHKRISQLSIKEPEFLERLIEDIVQKSSGVFLWVHLVVRSLLDGLTNFDSRSDLQRRLEELPPELNDLYSHMLDSIKPAFYVEQASRLFQIVYQSNAAVTALEMSFAYNTDAQNAITWPIKALSNEEVEERIEAISCCLTSRCAGLLELSRKPSHPVKEFLAKADIWSKMLECTKKTGFDANIALLSANLVCLKGCDSSWGPCAWKHIDLAIVYARKAEDSSGNAQIALLDELDRTGCIKMKNHGSRYRKQRGVIHWSAAMHHPTQGCHRCPESFLTNAIAHGLALYVETKLGEDIRQIDIQTERGFFQYATEYSKLPLQKNLPMIALLLRKGLDPNEVYERSTPWRNVLMRMYSERKYQEDHGKSLELELLWLEVCKVFIMYGADTNQLVKFGSENLSILDFLKSSFKHTPQMRVQEVKDLVRQKRSISDMDENELSFRGKRMRH